jgi:chromosome segregation protein
LITEVEDLEKSASSLRELITDLEGKINTRFQEGIVKINKEFQNFFELMFGGGDAALRLVKPEVKKNKKDSDLSLDGLGDEPSEELEEDNEVQEGVDIHVSLPRKKIKGLMMLSGGERALTSIALIFAMSQVNPPPFIILDETDAALDEANSRKYSDMIENLSEHSQLILITHNRETMSRAGIIYGVTMETGVSQLLSIKFDEGAQYAK